MTKDGFISVVMGFTGKQAALAALAARPTLKHLRGSNLDTESKQKRPLSLAAFVSL
ncbi:Rha family transcriptional regulator [Aeromonas sp. sif2433]|uniref:Rha family transcriptional regulator n=1 Tax=Aeromonas sp. sif2433 TaxID=2854794 RepID=UPI001C483BDF|nr:Rha family transcriptional regulator [Aeromonas sp. sif2433]MBV7413577.1 Rha family transcriptional regulator [Aeromonas sp. sif2433]